MVSPRLPKTGPRSPDSCTDHAAHSFAAVEDEPATLEVYDVQGLPMAQLLGGDLENGQACDWNVDGTSQSAGWYFARPKVGHNLYARRPVLSG